MSTPWDSWWESSHRVSRGPLCQDLLDSHDETTPSLPEFDLSKSYAGFGGFPISLHPAS
jgi:hypothetical protein